MSSHCDPAYADVIGRVFPLDVLDQHAASVVGLSGDDRIVYLNPLWSDFAAANGGQPAIGTAWDLGARYLEAVPSCLRPFYVELLARGRGERTWGRPIGHEYECSSGTLFRRFNMHVYGLDQAGSLLIVNSLLVERPFVDHERPPKLPDAAEYVDGDGIVHQCSHCRRIQSLRNPLQWDWVPQWVERSAPNTSHGLCEICLNYYYPAA